MAMPNIFGMFTNTNTVQPAAQQQPAGQQQQMQQQQQPQPGNIPPNSGQTDPANTTVPAGQVTQEQNNNDPLGQFKDIWQPVAGAPDPSASMFANVDPAKLMAAAQKTDFAKAIPADLQAKIQAGGAEGLAASMQAMNIMSQTVYANSAMATTKIVEQALAKQRESFEAALPGIIKKHSVSDSLRTENPIFSNPAVAPLVSAMESQLTAKYPNATAGEITAMAKQFIEGLGTAFSPAKQQQQETAPRATEDWSKFF